MSIRSTDHADPEWPRIMLEVFIRQFQDFRAGFFQYKSIPELMEELAALSA